MPWPFDPVSDDEQHRQRGAGAMERAMAAFPWETTSAGPVAGWPVGLKQAVRTLLDCQLPAHLCWGEDCIQFYNDAYTPLLDNKGDALGQDMRITWPEAWPDIAPLYARVRRGEPLGASGQRLQLNLHGFLETRYFTYSYSPVYGDDGSVGGVLATFIDTTDAIRAERRQALQAALAAALRSATEPLVLERAALDCIGAYFNGARVGFALIDPATGAAMVRVDLADGDDAARLDSAVPLGMLCFDQDAALRAGQTVAVADVARDERIADAMCWRTMGIVAGIVVPLMDEGRLAALMFLHETAPQHWILDETDILEDAAWRTWDALCRIRAKQALRALELTHDSGDTLAQEREQLLASERAARSEAERHNKMKDEFLAMLAHELRNPLAPITSAAQLLRLPEVNEGLRLKASNIISRQVRHMTELVDDLLDVSRVTRGLVKLENEVLDLNKVAMAAVEQARPHIEERLHALSVELPPAPVPVEGDRTRLIQVLVNLLNNSAKYTPQGGKISISVVNDGGAAEVTVRDNGSGIDTQLLPHVFDLFTQADRAPDRSQGGLGIGLALVKSIVRMHHGKVAAHSDGPQQGTTMTVTLPVAQAEVGQVVRAGEGGGETHPLAVTIVDDNGDAGHSLAVLLRAHGHTVHVYEDASSTLKAAGTIETDVFILDIGLPDMTGYELVRRLRREPRHAHAVYVALTGYGQQRDRELSSQAGFDHHLVKPVEIGKLAQILAAAGERKPAP
jgi:signal transduction histidine kinase